MYKFERLPMPRRNEVYILSQEKQQSYYKHQSLKKQRRVQASTDAAKTLEMYEENMRDNLQYFSGRNIYKQLHVYAVQKQDQKLKEIIQKDIIDFLTAQNCKNLYVMTNQQRYLRKFGKGFYLTKTDDFPALERDKLILARQYAEDAREAQQKLIDSPAIAPIKMFETAILNNKPITDTRLSLRIIELLLCNSTFNGINPTIFNDHFVDVFLNDNYLQELLGSDKKMQKFSKAELTKSELNAPDKSERLRREVIELQKHMGLMISVNRVFKYNSIYKENVYKLAQSQVMRKMMKNYNSSDYQTLINIELKQIFDRIYTLERITRYRAIQARTNYEKLIQKTAIKDQTEGYSQFSVFIRDILDLTVKKHIEQYFPIMAERRGVSIDTIAEGYEIEMEKNLDGLMFSDFYIQDLNLILEVNGQDHFYPYTRKLDQWSQYKQKIMRQNHVAYIPKNGVDPTADWPKLLDANGKEITSVPPNQKWHLINLNSKMLTGLNADLEKCQDFFAAMIELQCLNRGWLKQSECKALAKQNEYKEQIRAKNLAQIK